MNLFEKYHLGLSYPDFLAEYATDSQAERWQKLHKRVALSEAQRDLLKSFRRSMPVLCLAGAWCADCFSQCPIFEHFAAVAPVIQVRYLDRDDHADVQRELQINGGNRVPVVVFFSEDGMEVARYGDRTLAKYRQMMHKQAGASCPADLAASEVSLRVPVIQDWLNEFERVQWLLRLSPRLRQKHAD